MIFFCHLRPDDCDCISRPCRWGREAAGSEPSQVCFVLLQQQDLGVERQGQLDAMVRFQGIERDGVGQVRGSREVLVLILWGHGGTAPEDFPVCPESRTAQASRGVLLSTEPNVLANLFLWHLQQAEHHRTHWSHIGRPWAHHPWTSPGGSSLHLGLSGTVGEEVPEIAGWPHAGHGNSRVPQIILHLPLAYSPPAFSVLMFSSRGLARLPSSFPCGTSSSWLQFPQSCIRTKACGPQSGPVPSWPHPPGLPAPLPHRAPSAPPLLDAQGPTSSLPTRIFWHLWATEPP